MIAIFLCLAALLSAYWQSRKSISNGLLTVLGWGYFYGILRANAPTAASYFIFDCGVAGFYLARGADLLKNGTGGAKGIRIWTAILIGWPLLILFFPFQDVLISLVGLRGSIFFLPMLLAGALMTDEDLARLARGIGVLNIIAFAFALAEYFLGVAKFYPANAATIIIYASNDVAGYAYHRIPATFVTAHVYGSSMVMSLPLLFGLWARATSSSRDRVLALLAMLAAFVGVLLSATRLNFVCGVVIVLAMLIGREISTKRKAYIIAALVGIALLAGSNERMGRFKSLGDGKGVETRIGGSVNRSFFEIINEYPMGNGLGGGGTSIPAFLVDRINRPVMMENEYGRIALEQGIPGLAIWIVFLLWFAASSAVSAKTIWKGGRRAAWVCALIYFLVAPIGVGLFTSVPGSLVLFLFIGWVSAKPAEAARTTNTWRIDEVAARPSFA